MEGTVENEKSKACYDILSKVDNAMDSVEAARLTDSEFDSVKQLREQLNQACLAGDTEAAIRTEELIFAILKEGPPTTG